jgi:hypothetical protein
MEVYQVDKIMSVESRICRKKSLYLLNAEDMLEEYPELK